MNVYRELFFAGLPKPTARRQATTTRANDEEDDDGLAAPPSSSSKQQSAAPPLVTFPPALVKEMFARFGPITSFHFDVTRGVGAVSFENGEDAERCYVTAHLSLMRGASSGATEDDHPGGATAAMLSRVFGAHAAVLYVEFAQWLPFVNPLLLERSVSALSTMNRQLLRTFPVCDRRESSSTAMHIVYPCSCGPVETHGDAISLPGHGTMADLSLAIALVQVLFPVGAGKDHRITVLDLWAQFYEQFVVAKTQPSAQRISFPEFRFAAKASFLQDVVRFCQQAVDNVGSADGRMQLARFAEDDALHSTMAYVAFKTRMVHDPSHVSLLRAVDNKYAKLVHQDVERKVSAFGRHLQSTDFTGMQQAQHQPVGKNNGSGQQVGVMNTTDEQLLLLSLVDAAINVMENAQYMYQQSSPGERLSSAEEEEGARFERVLKLFDEFASSGSASSMLSICCPPEHFRSPSGLPANLPTMRGMMWRTFRVPLLIAALLFGVIFALVWHAE